MNNFYTFFAFSSCFCDFDSWTASPSSFSSSSLQEAQFWEHWLEQNVMELAVLPEIKRYMSVGKNSTFTTNLFHDRAFVAFSPCRPSRSNVSSLFFSLTTVICTSLAFDENTHLLYVFSFHKTMYVLLFSSTWYLALYHRQCSAYYWKSTNLACQRAVTVLQENGAWHGQKEKIEDLTKGKNKTATQTGLQHLCYAQKRRCRIWGAEFAGFCREEASHALVLISENCTSGR